MQLISSEKLLKFLGWLQENPQQLRSFGLICLSLSLLLLLILYFLLKNRYYVLQMQNVSLDETAIESELKNFCSQQKLLENTSLEIELKEQKIEILINFPHHPIEEQEVFLLNVERALGSCLKERLFYNGPFTLKATFPKTVHTV